MQVNSIQNHQSRPAFGIKMSLEVMEAADKFYCGNNHSQPQFNRFYRKIKTMEQQYGFNDYTVIMNRFYKNGKPRVGLFAMKDDGTEKNILLTEKDSVRKVLEKLIHINKYELSTKMNKRARTHEDWKY